MGLVGGAEGAVAGHGEDGGQAGVSFMPSSCLSPARVRVAALHAAPSAHGAPRVGDSAPAPPAAGRTRHEHPRASPTIGHRAAHHGQVAASGGPRRACPWQRPPQRHGDERATREHGQRESGGSGRSVDVGPCPEDGAPRRGVSAPHRHYPPVSAGAALVAVQRQVIEAEREARVRVAEGGSRLAVMATLCWHHQPRRRHRLTAQHPRTGRRGWRRRGRC